MIADLCDRPPAPAETAATKCPATIAAPDTKLSVLVAEDNHCQSAGMTAMLSRLGHRFDVVT